MPVLKLTPEEKRLLDRALDLIFRLDDDPGGPRTNAQQAAHYLSETIKDFS